METINALFSLNGKIGRLQFLGMIFLTIVFGFIFALMVTFISMQLNMQTAGFLIQNLVLLYFTYCIYYKRLNDIGGYHVLLNIHFGILLITFFVISLDVVNVASMFGVMANALLGLVIFLIAAIKKGANPIRVVFEGREVTLTHSMLEKVRKSFVPNFATTRMVVAIGGGHELITSKQDYENRPELREYADAVYVFHKHYLE